MTVRYYETDRMGIVHHSNYLRWFEVGRTELIKMVGFRYSELEKGGLLLPVVESHCQYRGSARYEDEIVVKATVKSMTPVRITFYYEVFNETAGKLITSGETMHVWTNSELKPVNLKKTAPEIYRMMGGQ